ncbi:MAG: lytic transglycosylase domain-containing protein [Acidobacteria bacterium]|nr:lytic transglycosylase domain-containing protein [Acidobacteriota bacterium]MCB9397120.1 lytic transglycosylase domain-containing protein [Acidobacteriota bacterium]
MRISFLLIVCFSLPAMAQLYSYRSPTGQLVITDQPVRKKGYKLVDKFIPREEKNVTERVFIPQSPYVLSEDQIEGLVVPIAKAYGVDPDLVRAVIEVESGRNARALSSKGAMGLMQLIPDTASRFGVKNAYDPRQNIKGGVQYLKFLLAYFEGDVDLALAGYNAGEGAVDKHGGIPPYKETKRYVQKVRAYFDADYVEFDETIPYRSVLIPNSDKPSVRKFSKTRRSDAG